MQDENYYSTSDLALAASILCLDYKLETLDRKDSRRAVFIFNRDEALNNVLDAYWGDNLAVNPRTYFDALKSLKTRLYDQV